VGAIVRVVARDAIERVVIACSVVEVTVIEGLGDDAIMTAQANRSGAALDGVGRDSLDCAIRGRVTPGAGVVGLAEIVLLQRIVVGGSGDRTKRADKQED
jgi:hypothetical protein